LVNAAGFIGTWALYAGWAHKYYDVSQIGIALSFSALFYLTFLTGGVILAIILLALPFMLISHIAGANFLNQYAWAYGAGLIHPTYLPNIGVFLSMLTTNPLIVTLVALGFIVGGFAIANVVFVNSARVMMAMGLDGSLPRFFSEVSEKRHTPVKAATLWSACALGVCAIFSYVPSWFTIVLIGGAIGSVIVVGVTCLAAAVFPYRAPEIFRASPSGRYMVGSVPLVTVMGVLGAMMTGALVVVALVNSALGGDTVKPLKAGETRTFAVDLPLSYDIENADKPKLAFGGIVTALRFSK
jgi:amino acid transporter